jgi:hypothetical protein
MKFVFGRFLQAFFPVRQQVLTLAPGAYDAVSVANVTGINFVSTQPCEYALIKSPTGDDGADFLAAGGRMLALGSLFGIHKQVNGIVFKNPNGVEITIYLEFME